MFLKQLSAFQSCLAVIVNITLVFSITTLHLLMHPLLDLSFENSSSCRLIESSCLENMRCIDPVIRPPSHNTVAIDLELNYRDLQGY